MKLCECGCGEPAPIAKRTKTQIGHVKGRPIRFISGHNAKGRGRTVRPGITQFVKLCECGCGNSTLISRVSDRKFGVVTGQPKKFIRGHAGSGFTRLEKGEEFINYVMTRYKAGARQRGLSWDLDTDDFRRLTSLDCHYCGAPPSMVGKRDKFNEPYMHNGLDRLRNDVGYQLDNVVTACKICNHAKADMTYSEFKAWIARVAIFRPFRPDVSPANAGLLGSAMLAGLDANPGPDDSPKAYTDQGRSTARAAL